MEYPEFRNTKGNRINILCIPCNAIPRSGNPVELIKKHDEYGKEISPLKILLHREQNFNNQLDGVDGLKFLQDRFPEYLKRH